MAKKYSVRVQVPNPLGVHARPATAIVTLVNHYGSCKVMIYDAENEGQAIGNSVISVLALGAGQGTWLDIEVEGEHAEELSLRLVALIDSGFGET